MLLRFLGMLKKFLFDRLGTDSNSCADSLWQNATDGVWILLPFSGSRTCSNCGPFYHRFFTQKGYECALAEYNVALNGQRWRRATGPIPWYAMAY
jgi:hypothetical protein